jgi:hypothetical protein
MSANEAARAPRLRAPRREPLHCDVLEQPGGEEIFCVEAVSSCLCNPGYTGPDGGTCVACEAGKNTIITGASVCLDCGAGTYSTTLAASAVGSCLRCPANSHSPPGSTAESACACNAGYSGPGACVALTALAPTTPLVLGATPAPSGAGHRAGPGLAQGVLPAIVLLWAGFS